MLDSHSTPGGAAPAAARIAALSSATLDLFADSPPWAIPVQPAPLDHSELEPWLRLTLTDGIGPATALKLLARFGLPEQILASDPAALRSALGPKLTDALLQPNPRRDEWVQRCLDWVGAAPSQSASTSPARHVIALIDPRYPRRLMDLADPPAVLFVLGDPTRLTQRSVAIVGSRQATRSGRQRAEAFAQSLAQTGCSIVSGLANGIDTAAHHGALSAMKSAALEAHHANATTIAVVGNGLDSVYPLSNRQLFAIIAEIGAIVSEQPPGALPLRQHFPRRNRMIAALSHGVLVVEAARQSGSLITARLAAELGREVFAIPGSPDSALAKGCHALIKQGAKLVETVDDVLDELPSTPGRRDASRLPPDARTLPSDILTPTDPLLDTLGWDPIDVETLARISPLTTAQLNAALLLLELDGRVERLSDGRYRRMPGRQA